MCVCHWVRVNPLCLHSYNNVSTEVLKIGILYCRPFCLPLVRQKDRGQDFETGFRMSLCTEHRRLLPSKVVE